MPIFEYRCKQCANVTEFLEKAGAAGKHPCGKCGSTKTEKMLSTFAAQSGRSAADACPAGDVCSRRDTCATGSCPFSP